LKRDLDREKRHLEAEERQKRLDMTMLPPPTPQPSETMLEQTMQSSTDGGSTNARNSPVLSSIPGRRPSAISISSLHRPQFPLKLDLSSTSLRITEEEANLFQKGLASPVTLAPKSARPVEPNEFPADLMAAFASTSSSMDPPHGPSDIDLLSGDIHLSQAQSNLNALGVGLGDSLDKPIELDLDAMDIDMSNMTDTFGDSIENGEAADNNAQDSLFSPDVETGDAGKAAQSEDNNNLSKDDENIISTFDLHSNAETELFGGDFTSGPDLVTEGGENTQLDVAIPLDSSNIMEQFPSAHDSTNPTMQESGEHFDINSLDLSNLPSDFFSSEQNQGMDFSMDMDTFFNMDSNLDQRAENNLSTPGQNPSHG